MSEPSNSLLLRLAKLYFGRLVSGRHVRVLKAIKEYDPGKSVSIVTFAGHKMMGEIRHRIRKEASYRKSGSISGLQFRIDAFLEKWYKENGLIPTPGQVAAELGIRVEGIVEVMRAGLVSFEDIDVYAIHIWFGR